LAELKPDAATTAPEPGPRHRAIRSFVVRAGRMTTAQERAWADLWPVYGLPNEGGPLDLTAIFGRAAAVTLEIGFGNGDSLAALAAGHPERDYLGIEVHPPGVGHLMRLGHEAGCRNLRILCADAVEALQSRIADAALDEVLLYFPDPWPKKRHHKRRIVQPAFLDLVARKLRPGGVLRMATDWEHYAAHMLETASRCTSLENLSPAGDYVERPASRPVTRFERRGQRLGHGVWDLAFRKPARPAPRP
jgi:tRNA (guanine-N7-)-methyltransferase